MFVVTALAAATYSADASAQSSFVGFGSLDAPTLVAGMTEALAVPVGAVLVSHMAAFDGILIGQWASSGRPSLGLARAAVIVSAISTVLSVPVVAASVGLMAASPAIYMGEGHWVNEQAGWVAASATVSVFSVASLVFSSLALARARNAPAEEAASTGPSASLAPWVAPGSGGLALQGKW